VRPLILAGAIATLAASGCVTAGAKAQPEPPSLEVPAPPPRVIVSPEPEPAAPATPVADPEPSQQKPARRPAAPRAEAKGDPARDRKVEPQPPIVETVRPVVPPPTATLQQALPATPTEVERQVREQLSQARADLGRVNPAALNADGRSQYDTAKRFIDQAEQALKEKNLVFAAKVAEKAAGLAASLAGRRP
jgi:hypothetical protein